MSAYIVIHDTVTAQAKMEQYVSCAIETLTAHGAEMLVVSDEATVLEGSPPFPRTISLKFSSREAVAGWYDSSEYRKALPLRLQASQGKAVPLNGLGAMPS